MPARQALVRAAAHVSPAFGTSAALGDYANMSPEYYRREASRARGLAAEQQELDTARLLLLLAAEYDELAEKLEIQKAASDG